MSVEQTTVMTVTEIANKLVADCREGKGTEFVHELYSDDAVSIEPFGEPLRTEGKAGILGKHAWWSNAFEVHNMEVSDPLIAGNFFSVTFAMDTTNKETKQRTQMSEVAVYEVKDGKVCREQFFYGQ